MKPKRLPEFEDPPWITPDGFFDPAKFPIEVPIRQCLDPTSGDFRDGCTFLGNMASRGRVDAGIFLLGLLRYYEEDLAVATIIVECLQHFHDARCVRVLISELRRVPSSNRTRRYLDTVINTLRLMPAEMVKGLFEELARDTTFSYKMRAKFASAREEVADRWHSSHDLEDRA
jgi:hypothetical protein